MRILESDWKNFKKLREIALERFSQRVLNECLDICCKDAATAHDRYAELYSLVQVRNSEIAQAFDDFRRSTAIICLGVMCRQELLTSEEISQFSQETRYVVERKGEWHPTSL